MSNFKNLKAALRPATKRINEEVGMLINQELTHGELEFLESDQKNIYTNCEDATIIVPLSMEGQHAGEIYLQFTLKEVIALSSALLGIPPARILEKRKFVLVEDDDLDAFAEVANIMTGALNATLGEAPAIKSHFSQQAHSRFTPEKTVVDVTTPIPDQKYLICTFPFGNAEIDNITMQILVPITLATAIDPGEQEPETVTSNEEEVSAEEEAHEEPPEEPSEEPHAEPKKDTIVLIFEEDVNSRETLEAILQHHGIDYKILHNEQGVQEEALKNHSSLLIMGMADVGDKEISVCIKLNNTHTTSGSSNISIIMAAQKWTREGVLKAVKYGVKDIVIKPYEANDVIRRVKKLI